MKTETQIAQENIKDIKSLEDGDFDGQSPLKRMSDFTELKKQSSTHKVTCQRFLEFLEEEMKRWETILELNKDVYISTGELEEKITDLKQAIKLYNEAGI